MIADSLSHVKNFITYQLVPSATRAGKLDKVPTVSVIDPSKWLSHEEAQRIVIDSGGKLGLGFVLTAEARIAVVDVDGSRDPLTGSLSLSAQTVIAMLPGAYVEVSVSGTGIHIWFSYSGAMPAHACKANLCELYHRDRFFALGTPYAAEGFTNGSVAMDLTVMLPFLVANYFPPSAGGELEWIEGHELGWELPDDGELIQRAMSFKGAAAVFGDKVSFSDLWNCNVPKLSKAYPDAGGRAYDESAADFALAGWLAWLTGNDAPRIERLMRLSGLQRDKWDKHRSYLCEKTIRGALKQDGNFYDPNYAKKTAGAPCVGAVAGPLTVPSGAPDELNPEDFWAHLPTHSYINRRTREFFSVEAVNGNLKRFTDQLGMKPAAWLDMFRAVQQMSWQPSYQEIIEGKVAVDGILKDDPKGRIYNLFRPSDATASEGDASPWINHVRYLYPEDAEHLFKWMAYRIQHPGRKINHAIVLGGTHGLGKDFMLEPLRYGVGVGNFEDIEYKNLFDNYSDWAERTLIVVNEARDTGGVDRYAFYESSKRLIAAPPDTLPCRKMYLGRYYVPNVMAVAITSNNKLNGLHIDPEDRRYYVAWSKAEKPTTAYFEQVWPWMLTGGGKEAALGYLRSLDISQFNPMAPPPRTEAWHDIVDAGRNPEEKELSDALEGVKVATVKEIVAAAHFKGQMQLAHMLQESKNARKIPHLLGSIDFEPLRNPHTKDGRWVISGRRETLYADRNLPVSESFTLANRRVAGGTPMVVVQ
jgi:hypothetical protein